ncbi:hypothetical protein AVEN_260273-1 [Araneus ventricosus]|uniref:Uncharacterized protein n=1 Tax=Araneus ventricosus TaxID=182803 RepID=A0A4Y2FKU2_ARAVE|nr:hypothetical protein AVEN_260273-1 [Araneus ventricosus]
MGNVAEGELTFYLLRSQFTRKVEGGSSPFRPSPHRVQWTDLSVPDKVTRSSETEGQEKDNRRFEGHSPLFFELRLVSCSSPDRRLLIESHWSKQTS